MYASRHRKVAEPALWTRGSPGSPWRADKACERSRFGTCDNVLSARPSASPVRGRHETPLHAWAQASFPVLRQRRHLGGHTLSMRLSPSSCPVGARQRCLMQCFQPTRKQQSLLPWAPFQDPPWMPETADSAKTCMHHVLSYVHPHLC